MRLTCPACGAVCSAEAWLSDAASRQVLKAACELPGPVARHVLGYIALFRGAGGRGLSWARALRLIGEVADLVANPHVQWEGKVARPNDAMAWAEAMERMIERPPRRLPLTSHGYLRAIAYEIADEKDRGREVRANAAERTGAARPRREAREAPERLDPEWMKQISDTLRKKKGG